MRSKADEGGPNVRFSPLALIGATRRYAIIDIGGGASRIVDSLVYRGYEDVTVLDLSETALTAAKDRIGDKAMQVNWIATDVTIWEPSRAYDVWHDRRDVPLPHQARRSDRLC